MVSYYQKPSVSHSAGFTLLEISIVIVIIGLIIGSIFVGKELLHTAEIRSFVSQYQQYATAFNTFKLKYNCNVGVCLNERQLFGTQDKYGNTISNGNGSGQILPYNTRQVCFDLVSAGLVEAGCTGPWGASGGGTGVTPNVNALPSTYKQTFLVEITWLQPSYWNASHLPPNNYAMLALQSSSGSWYPTSVLGGSAVGILPIDAQSVDLKIDDGAPYTGKLLQADFSCGSTVTNKYNTTSTNDYSCANFYQLGQ